MTSNELGTMVHFFAERAIQAGACMSIDGVPVFPCATLVTPETYERTWRAREHGRRVQGQAYFYAHYVSTFVETDCGVELEVSALVDLRPGHRSTTVGDFRFRVAPSGAEVEVAFPPAVLSEIEQRLTEAAMAWAR